MRAIKTTSGGNTSYLFFKNTISIETEESPLFSVELKRLEGYSDEEKKSVKYFLFVEDEVFPVFKGDKLEIVDVTEL